MSSVVLRLPAAFSDVSAADLRLGLDLPPQDALVTRTVADGERSLDLRILGASHQVLVIERGSVLCSETVACGTGAGGPDDGLPRGRVTDLPGARHRFWSTTSHLAPDALRTHVDDLLATLAADPAAVCGVFPGDPLAVTGVQARFRSPRTAAWRTWHSYPQTGEVVVTCTRVERLPAAADLLR
jgi:hypothetical protein